MKTPTPAQATKTIRRYHVFGSDWSISNLPTDNWYETRKAAEEAYRALEHRNKRLYVEEYADEAGMENDEMLEENCLRSRGAWPA